MIDPCTAFRARLEQQLLGRAPVEEMRALAWHEHLLGCADCRDLLAAEEALELLLASLPEPRLPADMARRVLSRLRAAREAEERALDALLALDAGARPPPDLARAVLAGLREERGPPAGMPRDLDALLALDEVAAPSGLGARVLAGLAPQRAALRPAARSGARLRAVLAIAAGLVALIALLARWPWSAPAGEELARLDGARTEAAPEGEVPRGLLEALDVLEEWELLMQDDPVAPRARLDLWFSTFEPTDELLLDYRDESLAEELLLEDRDAGAIEDEDPSKG